MSGIDRNKICIKIEGIGLKLEQEITGEQLVDIVNILYYDYGNDNSKILESFGMKKENNNE